MVTRACEGHFVASEKEIDWVETVYSYMIGDKDYISFTILMSMTVFLYCIIMIYKLRGLQKLGELIIMVNFMIIELK
jgi:hypothetical protein